MRSTIYYYVTKYGKDTSGSVVLVTLVVQNMDPLYSR